MTDEPKVECICPQCGSKRIREFRREVISYRVDEWSWTREFGIHIASYGKEECEDGEHLRFQCWRCDAVLGETDLKVEVDGVLVKDPHKRRRPRKSKVG